MTLKFVLVVGDKFETFAARKDVLTITQLRGLLALQGVMAPAQGRMVLVPGQGLKDADFTLVQKAEPDPAHFDLSLWKRPAERAPATHSHKHLPHNTLISIPRRNDDGTFHMDLLIDQDCELMGDHQSGQHVQGMLLVEAARQSFLAVTEAFFLPHDGSRYNFIFDGLGVTYKRFVFPVDACLTYVVKTHEPSANRHRFDVEVSVEQCGLQVAVVTGAFTAVKDARMARIEAGLASEILGQHLADAADRLSEMQTGAAA